MKKTTVLIIAVSLLMLNAVHVPPLYSQQVTEKIASKATAEELAVKAGGTYMEGPVAPALSGTQVALPVIDESSKEPIGYIIAEKDKLVSVLNEAGYTDVASALSAAETTAEAGASAGFIAETGIAAGTIGIASGIAAGAAGIALAIGGGGGGGGGDGTTPTTAHH